MIGQNYAIGRGAMHGAGERQENYLETVEAQQRAAAEFERRRAREFAVQALLPIHGHGADIGRVLEDAERIARFLVEGRLAR